MEEETLAFCSARILQQSTTPQIKEANGTEFYLLL
jgi:hypothetical protein